MVVGTSSYHEFQIIGRHVPTTKEPNPKIYRMRIFARNRIWAKSRFWFYLSQFKKVKRATGEILSLNEIYEKKPNKIKNFGIVLRYISKTGTHNIYKEYRDTSRVGAVQQLYQDMAGQYRARFRAIQIISVGEVKAADCRRANTKQFHDFKIKFPLPHRVLKRATKKVSSFVARRPSTHI